MSQFATVCRPTIDWQHETRELFLVLLECHRHVPHVNTLGEVPAAIGELVRKLEALEAEHGFRVR